MNPVRLLLIGDDATRQCIPPDGKTIVAAHAYVADEIAPLLANHSVDVAVIGLDSDEREITAGIAAVRCASKARIIELTSEPPIQAKPISSARIRGQVAGSGGGGGGPPLPVAPAPPPTP